MIKKLNELMVKYSREARTKIFIHSREARKNKFFAIMAVFYLIFFQHPPFRLHECELLSVSD